MVGMLKFHFAIDLLINGPLDVKFDKNIAHKHRRTLYRRQKLHTSQVRVCNLKVMCNILNIL
jgi:hypothetical protein